MCPAISILGMLAHTLALKRDDTVWSCDYDEAEIRIRPLVKITLDSEDILIFDMINELLLFFKSAFYLTSSSFFIH